MKSNPSNFAPVYLLLHQLERWPHPPCSSQPTPAVGYPPAVERLWQQRGFLTLLGVTGSASGRAQLLTYTTRQATQRLWVCTRGLTPLVVNSPTDALVMP